MDRKFSTGKPAAEKCYQLGKARDIWRELMLDVRAADGGAFAFPYSHLSFIKLEANAITLSFSTHIVTIEGENLRPLYEALSDHSVRYVTAISAGHDRAVESESVISGINVVALGQGGDAMM